MAEQQTTPDPTAAFRELVSQWEKSLNEVANRTMNSEEFTRAMNKATTASTTTQQQLGELIGRYLSSLNLPTRTEMVSIGERLQAIETSLHRLTTQLEKLAGTSAAGGPASGPPRTKRPPSAGQSGGAS